MNNFVKLIVIFGYAIVALACSQSKEVTGKATLSGKFVGSFPVEKTFTVKLTVPNLVEGESKQMDEYETQLETDGSFALSIPLFRSVYGMLSVNDEELGAFFLSPDKETKIDLSLIKEDKIQVKVIKGQELTPEDLDKTNKLFMEFIQKVYDTNSLSGLRYDMSPEEYKDYILNWTEKQLSIVEKNENLSEDLKWLLGRQLKWNTYIGPLFNYESQIHYLYENQRQRKELTDTIFTPAKPDKSYYSFLNYFDWSNSPVFNTPSYPHIFQALLADSILNIPDIENKSLTEWLKDVKTTMSPLIGSDTGIFYDMLTLHAYMNQLDNNSKPLSEKQIEDIKTYFKNPTFAKYLFVKNEALIKQTQYPVNVKETPAVNKEKLMDAIVSTYKGKAVVVDFWATWCGPCMAALSEAKSMKEEFINKNVVFVYITDVSSPKELWGKKIQNISGEHYYLTKEESESIASSKQYHFDGIPTYFLFDSTGILKNKITGYPGNADMQKMIQKLVFP